MANYLTTPDKLKLSKSGSQGEDVLQIFAPTAEALQAEMAKYEGFSRQGRVDPSLTGIQYFQQTIGEGGKWIEPSAHGTGSYSEFLSRLDTGNLGQPSGNAIAPIKGINPDLILAGAFPGNPAGGTLNTAQPGQPITSSQGKSPEALVGAIQNQGKQPLVFSQAVLDEQKALNTKGAGLKEDGLLGPLTLAARAKYGATNTPQNTPTYDANTGFLTDYGKSIGAKEVNAPTSPTAPQGGTSPAVQTSGQARTEAKLAEIQKAITDATPKPLDTFTSESEKQLALARNDKTAIESELADIQGAKMALEDEFRKYKVQSGREISQAGYEGGLSEKSRELQFQADTLARKEFVLETKLQSKNSVISELMKNQQLDYASAVDQYNTNFSQAIQLYGIINKEDDELKTNAKATLDVLSKSYQTQIEAGTLDVNNLTGLQKLKLEEYETQAGYPVGVTLASLSAMKPNETIQQKGVDSSGNYYEVVKKADGSLYTRKLNNVASPDEKNGLTPAQINSTVNSIAGAFDNEPIVKGYNTVQEGFQTISSIGVNTKSPADDIAFIYAFAKIMDPNSVVREGEYNTIQKYAQTWADNFGFSAKRIFSNTNFLTADAKQKMLNALQPKINTITNQYKSLQSEYQRQIQDAYAGQPRKITDYSLGNTNQKSSGLPSDIGQKVQSNLTFSPDNKTAYLPRAIWSTLGQYMDDILQEAERDGVILLIK